MKRRRREGRPFARAVQRRVAGREDEEDKVDNHRRRNLDFFSSLFSGGLG